MESEWRVSSNFIGEQKMYIVYRIRNTSETDHSGNREYAGGYVDNRELSQAIADNLNANEPAPSANGTSSEENIT